MVVVCCSVHAAHVLLGAMHLVFNTLRFDTCLESCKCGLCLCIAVLNQAYEPSYAHQGWPYPFLYSMFGFVLVGEHLCVLCVSLCPGPANGQTADGSVHRVQTLVLCHLQDD